MKKSQKNLLHGCRVPAALLATVLTMEYGICFCGLNPSLREKSLCVGYLLLTGMITCNNHGRNVRVKYEQELSLILKCVVTNFSMGSFLCAAYMDTGGFSCFFVMERLLLLTLLQIVSICFLCAADFCFKAIRRRGCRLYLYGKHPVRMPDVVDGICLFVQNASMELIDANIKACDEVYLFDLSAEMRNDLLKKCFAYNKQVYFTVKLSDMELRSASLSQDGDMPVFYWSGYGIGRVSAVLKRLFDVLLSVFLLFILLPLFLVIAVCIRLDDGGSIFYRQIRCTAGMKEFQIMKFRSMTVGAEEQCGVRLADKGDQRLTRTGYFLRKTKLDELPQLFNILRGDMSFVGPRPERPELIQRIVQEVPEFTFRTTVKAGLTGYAQVHGAYHTDFLDKLKWDLIYIENYSLLLDLKIIFMTIPVVLRGSSDV